MNILIKSTLAAAMSASLLLPMAVQAADITTSNPVQINGTIIAHACKVDIKSVEMGSVSTKQLKAVGALSDKKDLTIKLTECVKGTNATVKFSGDAPSEKSHSNLLSVKNAKSKREDVGIEIYKKSEEVIALGAADVHTLKEETNNLVYKVAYKTIALPIAIGDAIGTLNVDIIYT